MHRKRKGGDLGTQSVRAKRVAKRRDEESQQARSQRLENSRISRSQRLADESEQERRERHDLMRNQMSQRRANESEQERQQRLLQQNQIRANQRHDQVPVQIHYLGGLMEKCEFCGSKNFKGERPSDGKFTYCCQKGKLKLENLNQYPKFLENLLTKTDDISKRFRQNIWRYNSAHAFVSFGCQSPSASLPGRGPDIFSVQGAVYHLMSTSMCAAEGDKQRYAKLYFMDTNNAIQQRFEQNEILDLNVIRELSTFIIQNNILAQTYKMMRYVVNEKNRRGSQIHNLTLLFSTDVSKDQRRFNAPQVNEIAVVFQNADGEPPLNRDIRVYFKNSNHTQNIPVWNEHFDALTYPILYPHGESGWKNTLKLLGTNRCVTQMMYYSHILAIRDKFSPFVAAGKLSQVFVVDAYIKMEANRLNYIQQSQQKLRRNSYTALKEYLERQALQRGVKPGNIVILPSSFTGSPRNMQQRYLDAMTMVAKFGKPDLFITMTCNPTWDEITENLGEISTENKPGLVAKVFNLKRQEFLNDLFNRQIFGKVTAFVYVIEFQKIGLPHLHLLLMLANEDKPRNAIDIDKIIWAEIPEQSDILQLTSTVLKHTIHGPCVGSNAAKFMCTKDTKTCVKDFPKAFQDETLPNSDGYPKYQRRNTGIKHIKGSNTVDNSWAVPYNPYLLKRFDCHINVEFCSSVKSVKYMYKYVNKGHDCAHIEIKSGDGTSTLIHDETRQYIDSRYVCAVKAMWRINGYTMYDKSHTIIRLPIHLENAQNVHLQEDADIEQVVNDPLNRETMLTAYFTLNSEDPHARNYHYAEIPEHYVFENKLRKWKLRQRGGDKIIGRIYSASLHNPELYFLRVLLLHIKGARNYEELRTVDDVIQSTFRAAAVELNLVEDDTLWDKTLNDAAHSGMPDQIRQLFATICAFESPQNPLQLWNNYKQYMIEDFVHRNIQNPDNQALLDINKFLKIHGKSCAHFGLPTPVEEVARVLEYNQDEERESGETLLANLNQQQRQIYETVMGAIDNPIKRERCFCVDGAAGTGKTYLFNTLMSVLRGRGDVVLPCASTGIAATLLKGGRTYHSLFKLRIPLNEASVITIGEDTAEGMQIRNAKLIIWDEVSMTLGQVITMLDNFLQRLTNDSRPFRGKVILFAGDFRQNLPVVKHAHHVQIMQASVKSNSIWINHVSSVKLTQNMRTGDELQFAEWLLQLGEGQLTSDYELPPDVIEIPNDFISTKDLITEIFGDHITVQSLKDNPDRAILCPKNDDTFRINDRVLNLLSGEKTDYVSIDSVEADNEQEREYYPLEFLHSITPSGLPQHLLSLNIGTIIILLRNINTERGLCNGTRLIVTELKTNLIFAEVLAGPSKGKIIFIPRIDIIPADSDYPFVLKRRQFPVRIAFAMTINKSQGQTLQNVGIFLPNPVFSHGQLYVAFSRATSRKNVSVHHGHRETRKTHSCNFCNFYKKHCILWNFVNNSLYYL